ncbi:MAG: fibronectin type III domain-containing protein, partial [Planctomycetes bacterium]|nr:fibronectin type III domain-containing protein [Planctomycetota bacterium]
SQALSASGGNSPYTWAITVGSLPAGLTLSPATGVISGVPTSVGTPAFTVQVTDSTTPSADTASQALSITIDADTIAPSAITTLAASAASNTSVLLTWTAPGDDGMTGTCSSYEIRYATAAIVTAGDWAAATLAGGAPPPSAAGSPESFTVTSLSTETTYFFGVRATDDSANQGAVGNSPSARTDVTAPTAIADLATGSVTSSSVDLTWTATGDNGGAGTAASYGIRYATTPILTVGDFASATPVTGEPAPASAGTLQTMTVTGLSSATTYYFQISVSDEIPNTTTTTGVSPSATTAVGSPTNLSASAGSGQLSLSWDTVSGANGYTVYYDVDGPGAPYMGVGSSGGPSPIDVGLVTSYALAGLSNSVTYYVAVRAYTMPGPVEGNYSNEVAGTPVGTTSVTSTRALTGGNTTASNGLPKQRAYRMVGWPCTPSNSDPIANLEDDLGPYNTQVWRLWGWSNGA